MVVPVVVRASNCTAEQTEGEGLVSKRMAERTGMAKWTEEGGSERTVERTEGEGLFTRGGGRLSFRQRLSFARRLSVA